MKWEGLGSSASRPFLVLSLRPDGIWLLVRFPNVWFATWAAYMTTHLTCLSTEKLEELRWLDVKRDEIQFLVPLEFEDH
jgi:hypothetical protein